MCEIRVIEGGIIKQYDSHPARAGVVIAGGATRQDAIANAEWAIKKIEIETKPVTIQRKNLK